MPTPHHPGNRYRDRIVPVVDLIRSDSIVVASVLLVKKSPARSSTAPTVHDSIVRFRQR
jgi:hypothetical protein